MRNHQLSIFLGLATTATVALYAPQPVQAEVKLYQTVSGKESLRLDLDGLAVLESIGLSFASVESTAVPALGYDYGFNLLPPSTNPDIRGTDSNFVYDADTGYFAPLDGVEALIGSIFFNVDTTKLNLAPQLELGDFSVSYGFSTGAEVVSIIDTVNTDLSVLNVAPPSAPPTFNFESQTWVLDDVDVVASQEFNDFLAAAGATTNITGLKLVEGRLDRGFVEVSSTPVPEPGSALGILVAAGAALAAHKWRKNEVYITKKLTKITMLKKFAFAIGIVFIALGVGEAAQAATFEVVASGLDNPRDIAFSNNGTLYVTEAGRGGTGVCIPSPSQPGQNICYGATGAVTRIENGASERVVTGLPSLAFANGSVGYGIHDIAFAANGKAYGVIGLASDPAERDNRPDLANFAQLIRFDNLNGGSSWTNIADLGSYERSNNPDGTDIVTNPYSLLIEDNNAIIVDSGANDLLRVALDGSNITVQAVFDEHYATEPPSPQDSLLQSVPTAIATDPDGTYYVSEFTGFPYPEDAARIYRIGADNQPETYVDGFTNIIDLAFDSQRNLYVLELADGSLASGDRTGALTRVAADGTRTILATDELVTPTALEVGPDGDIYVSNYGLFAGQGQVVRFEGAKAVPEPTSVLGVLAFGVGMGSVLKHKRKHLA